MSPVTLPFWFHVDNNKYYYKQEKRSRNMAIEKKETKVEEDGLKEFPIDVKRDILDIINDAPSLVRLGSKEYKVKGMRFYSVYRIARLCLDMKEADELMVSDDNKIVTALCTDLDAMCEIMAIILCNHLFTPDGVSSNEEANERNERLISTMKMKVMNSTFEPNEWAAIILGALKSIDLSAFFLLKKSVSTATDSLLMRKRKSQETVSQFMEALSLQTRQTS